MAFGDSIVSYWFPSKYRDSFSQEEILRVRLFVGILLISQIFSTAYLLLHLSNDRFFYSGVLLVQNVVLWTSLFFLKRNGDFNLVAYFSLGFGTLIVTVFSTFTGGINSPFAIWLLVIPVGCSFFLEKKGIGLALVSITLAILVLLIFDDLEFSALISFTQAESKFHTSIAFFFLTLTIIKMFQFYFNKSHLLMNELEKSYKKSDTLVSIICHDLASPIQVFLESLDHLGKAKSLKENSDARKHLEALAFSADYIEQIVRNVRCMQSMEKGGADFDLGPTNLRAVCENVIDDYESRLDEKNLSVETEYQSEALVYAESSTLETNVLGNIMSNAIKFSRPDGVIRIRIVERDSWVLLEFIDGGYGIDAESLQAVFASDCLISKAGTRGEKGNGLGLKIVKGILDIFEAEIEIRNREGVETGAVVAISFKKWRD